MQGLDRDLEALSKRTWAEKLAGEWNRLVRSVRTSVEQLDDRARRGLGEGAKKAWRTFQKEVGKDFEEFVGKIDLKHFGGSFRTAFKGLWRDVKQDAKAFLNDLLGEFLKFAGKLAAQKVLQPMLKGLFPSSVFGVQATSGGITPEGFAINPPVVPPTTGQTALAGIGAGLAGVGLGMGVSAAVFGTEREHLIGSGVGGAAGATLGFIVGGPLGAFLGGALGGLAGGALGDVFGGGRKARRRKRRARARASVERQLAALGVDTSMVDAFEAAFGQFGEGSGQWRSENLLGIARAAGLSGEVATRGFRFVLNLGQTLQPALDSLTKFGDTSLTGLAERAEQVREVLGRQTPEGILEGWKEVDAFFQDFARVLAGIGSALAQGVQQALNQAVTDFLHGAADWRDRLAAGLRSAIEGAIVEAVVQGAILKGAFGTLLDQLTEALATGQDPAGIIQEIAARIPLLAETIETTLAPLTTALDTAFPRPTPPPPPGVTVLDEGGIVRGPMLAALALNRRPEAVVPLDQAGRLGGETTIIVELNDRMLAKALVPLIPGIVRVTTGVARS